MARDFVTYGTTLPTLVERLALEKEQLQIQKDLLEDQFDGLQQQLNDQEGTSNQKRKNFLKSVPPNVRGETLEETVSNLLTEVDALRARPPKEIVPPALLERMEAHEDRSWDSAGTDDASRAVAFLDFLIEQPKKLLERFRELVRPIVEVIGHYPAAEKLLRFVKLGRYRG